MGRRHAISDADWDRMKGRLPGQPGQHGGIADNNRRFLDAVFWIARTGGRGRICRNAWATGTAHSGGSTGGRRRGGSRPWRRRSATRPGRDGVGFDGPPRPPVRRRSGKKVDGTGGQDEQAHGGVNGLGQPVTLVPTAGQESDIGRAEARLAGHAPEGVIADEGYECEAVVEAVIPSRANRVGP